MELPQVNEVVDVLNITRNEFAFYFLQSQYKDIPLAERMHFEAVGRAADDKEAFRQALNFASLKGFFRQFLQLVINSGADKGALIDVLKVKNPGNVELQAMLNPAAGIPLAGNFAVGFPRAMRWTGKVLIGNQFQGSGVLIGPTSFLTSWHVVKSMFDVVIKDNVPVYAPRKPAPKLEVVFEDILTTLDNNPQQEKTLRVRAAENWFENYSECHPEELNWEVTEPYNKLEGFWDYAIIKLLEVPGNERVYAKLDKNAVVPVSNAQIVIFQHPLDTALGWGIEKIYDLQPPKDGIPRLRFMHLVNAAPGSSGGPCFDKDFSLIGIHQGTWKSNGTQINVGIPILNIIVDLQKKMQTAGKQNLKEDFYIFCLVNQDYAPVIGCDEFQELVLGMANQKTISAKAGEGALVPVLFKAQEGKTVIAIDGDPGTGKTFMAEVLIALLNEAEHLKIKLSGQAISKMTAPELIASLCSLAGIDFNEIQSFKSYNSTPATWLKDAVIVKLIELLDKKRGSRLVWICITDLNKFDVTGKDASDFILLLFEQVLKKDWLRIVVTDVISSLPRAVEEKAVTYTTRKIELQDMTNYVNRFSKQLKQNFSEDHTTKAANKLYNLYTAFYQLTPATAIEELSKQCRKFFDQLIDKLKGN